MSEFDLEKRTKEKVEEIAGSIKMQWDTPTYDRKILLLVENDNDRRCYFKMFNTDRVGLKTSQGCNCMRRLFDTLQVYGIPNFAIQDSDFARVCGVTPHAANYFFTDFHDHEMMCLSDDEVMKAIFVNLAIEYDKSLVDGVFDDLKTLSLFKWYNYSNHLNLNFKGYNPRGKKRQDLCSFVAIHNAVMPQSPNSKVKSIKESEVAAFVRMQPKYNRYEVTNGHDFLAILAQRISEKHIELKNLSSDYIRPIIYTCFTFERFVNTKLYQRISSWAAEAASDLFAA